MAIHLPPKHYLEKEKHSSPPCRQCSPQPQQTQLSSQESFFEQDTYLKESVTYLSKAWKYGKIHRVFEGFLAIVKFMEFYLINISVTIFDDPR